MKYAPIVSTPMLDYVIDWDYHMVLAHQLLADAAYAKSYSAKGSWYKILDNGVAEGEKISNGQLLDLAYKVGADEVIAPDVMHETKESIRKLIDFTNTLPTVKVMAVMQARNWIDFNRIFDVALECEVSSIALPKLLTGWIGSSARLAAAEIVREACDLPIHCLGCSTHLTEAQHLARQGIVRGIDSAAPVVLGLQDLPIKNARYDWKQSHSAIPDFWGRKINDQVKENLDTFREWCEQPATPVSEM
jgi:hypothetical protein